MRKTALITGASKRIGKSIAQHLASKGWNVAVHFNTSEIEANKLVEDLILSYPDQKFEIFLADLAEIKKVVSLIQSVKKVFGPIQLLVNNASVFEQSLITETSPELYDEQLNVNLRAPFFLMKDFVKYCKTGNIINIVDTRITQNQPDYSAYSLSKKGLWEVTKMAALEFAPAIRVNAIAPGVTLPPVDKDDEYLQQLAKTIPMKSPAGIEPILKSIDYILVNEHLTGQLLFADGGENLGKKK